MDKYQKIERVFEGLQKINKEALQSIEQELGREITFCEYVEKYMEDVTAGYLAGFVDAYPKGKTQGQKDSKRKRLTILRNKK